MVSGVYVIANLATDKIYVGSSVDVDGRWRIHLRHLRSGKHHSFHLQRAWDKYGETNFCFGVLEEVTDPSQLVAREQEWINLTSAADPAQGYNVSPTAGNQLGFRHSDTTRTKMSASHKGVPLSPEHRASMSAVRKGKPPSNTGVPRSPEACARIAEGRKGNTNSLGRRFSAESRAKIAARMENNTNSLGCERSVETRARMAEARRAWWAHKRAENGSD